MTCQTAVHGLKTSGLPAPPADLTAPGCHQPPSPLSSPLSPSLSAAAPAAAPRASGAAPSSLLPPRVSQSRMRTPLPGAPVSSVSPARSTAQPFPPTGGDARPSGSAFPAGTACVIDWPSASRDAVRARHQPLISALEARHAQQCLLLLGASVRAPAHVPRMVTCAQETLPSSRVASCIACIPRNRPAAVHIQSHRAPRVESTSAYHMLCILVAREERGMQGPMQPAPRAPARAPRHAARPGGRPC